MQDKQKTKEELLRELNALRRRVTEFARAEEELLFKTALLEAQSETTIDGILVVDSESKAVLFNKRFGQMWNIPQQILDDRDDEKMLRCVIEQLQEPDKFLERVKYLYSHKEEKSRDEIEFKDGKVFDRYSAPLLGPEGEYYGRIWYFRDITEHKQAGEKVKQAAEEWITTFDSISDLVSIQDKDLNIVRANKAFADTFKMKPEELIGKKCYEVIHGTKEPWPDCPHRQIFETRKPARAEFFEPNLGINLEVSTSPIFNGEKEITGSVHIAKDITERKRAEEALWQSEERFKTIFENIAVGVYRTTPDGRILMANPAIVRMLGYSSFEELAQRSLEKEGYEPQYPRSTFKERIEKDGQVVGFESAWVRRDGTTLFIIENSRVVRDENGNTLYYEGTAEDITERKEAEDALKESEERFRTIFDKAADGIMLADVESKKIYMGNSVMCQMLDYDPEEVKKLGVVDVHPEEDLAYVIEQFERQAKGEITLAKDIPVKRKDGSVFYADVNAFPVTLAGKMYLMGIFRDITERKHAEVALRESEERYRTLVENLPQRVFLKDCDSTYISCNENFARDVGISSQLLPGKNDYDLFPVDLAEKYKADDKRVMESGEIRDIEDTAVLRGQEMIIHTVKTPVRDEEGNVTGVLGIFWDITEHHLMEQALHESEEKYRTLVESADETIATIDKDGVFLFLNRRGAEGLGGEPNDYIGKTMRDVFPGEIAERQAMSVRSVINTGKGMIETAITELKGRQRWYETIIEPLRDNNGKVVAALVIGRDVHEIKQAEEELGRYREEMARAEQLASLGTLSATLAHELMQPLTVICLSLEDSLSELEATSCSETVIEGIRDSLAEVSNVTSIAERFRNFARRSSGKTVSKVDLKVVAERIVKLLNKSAQHAQVTLDVKKGMDNLPPIYSNEKDIEQLFFALVQNAIQAADGSKPCKLVINGAVKGKRIELRFSDNCDGIAPEDLDKIFEPFFTTKPAGEGTGLGLCIVDRIAEESGGGVRVENKPGKGSTFVVALGINRDRRP